MYRALAVGVMAVTAPATAVCSVAVPVVFDFLRGQRLPPLSVLGMGLAVVAIVLLSGSNVAPDDPAPPSRRMSRGVGLALLSGVAIGLFFIALDRTDAAAGMWPLLAARATSTAGFLVLALAGSHPLMMRGRLAALSVGGGVLDVTANVWYLIASWSGTLSVIVTLVSLYPASTLFLARVTLGERLSRRQGTGVACALVALLLMIGAGA